MRDRLIPFNDSYIGNDTKKTKKKKKRETKTEVSLRGLERSENSRGVRKDRQRNEQSAPPKCFG